MAGGALAARPSVRIGGRLRDNVRVPKRCVFCGSDAALTREHVFGKWVAKTGLDLSPLEHHAGPLNALPRHLGNQPPYRQEVRDVCGACNNGWMSRLESAAQPVLTPLILGDSGAIAVGDQPMIAMWAQKTALTAMLLSSKEQRDNGYGLAPSEYRALYDNRESVSPLSGSQFWVGRFEGDGAFAAVRVTPLTVRIPELPEPHIPQAYAMTIVLGALIIHGVRFPPPARSIDAVMTYGFPQLWPTSSQVDWPAGQVCTEETFVSLADAGMLHIGNGEIQLRPWRHAAHLPQSAIENGMVKVRALCHKHDVYYPPALLQEALNGTFYAFMVACECSAYIVHTNADRVRFRAAGPPEGISQMYEDMPGDEYVFRDRNGEFICKQLPD